MPRLPVLPSQKSSYADYVPMMATIAGNVPLTGREHYLSVEPEEELPFRPLPGQFVQLTVFGVGEAPISVNSMSKGQIGFDLCVRKAGKVTEKLCEMKEGDYLGIRGPYGNGFPVNHMKQKDVLMLAGGLGIACLRYVYRYIMDNRSDYQRVILIYGAPEPSDILFFDELEGIRKKKEMEVHLVVENPDSDWKDKTGVATKPLSDIMLDPENTRAVIAGPPILYRFATEELVEMGLEKKHIYLTLERNFQCGIGKCGHCQINDLYVCRDGPVFTYERLLKRIEATEAPRAKGE